MEDLDRLSSDELKKEITELRKKVSELEAEAVKAEGKEKIINSVFTAAPFPMGIVRNRILIHANRKLCELTGYDYEELVGTSSQVLYSSDDEFLDVGRRLYDKLPKSNVSTTRATFKIKNGNNYETILSASYLDPDKPSQGIVFGIIDISEKKRYEKMLRDNREKFMTFFNNINDAVLVHPWKEEGFGRFTEVNDFAVKRYGYTRSEFMKLSPENLHNNKDAEKESSTEKRTKLLNDGSKLIETEHITKSGEIFPVEINSRIITVDGQKSILSLVRDLSDRRKSEIELQESERKYREMFELSPEAMLIIDKSGKIVKCNNSFYQLSGFQPGVIENKHFISTELFTAAKIPEYLKLFAKLLVKKESSTIDFEWKHKTLGKRSGTAHVGPMLKQGRITGLQAYVKDTTKQKEFEKKLIEAKEKAEENDRLKSTFLATMSHELRTPLNAVIGFSELVDKDMDIDSILEMNQIINENGQRLLKIIESIFEISSLEAKKPELKKEVFSLDEMFSILGNSLKSYIGCDRRNKYNLVYSPDIETGVKFINTDRYKLEQLLSNLLTNAAKYTPEGEINYGFSTSGRDITFFVKDSGIGIPQDKQAIIFEKFRQIDDSYTRKQDGIGLGLAICKELAKILGGELWLESEKGKGSVFYFTLPGAVAERPESNKNDKSSAPPGMNGNSVLIVEDEESNYLYLKTLISKTGAHISWAKNGEESIEMVSKNPGFSLVLMDIRMPGMDGYEATRIIKEMHPTMRVIAQTAYAMKADRERAYKNGFDGYISKPIDKRSLYNLLDEPEKPIF